MSKTKRNLTGISAVKKQLRQEGFLYALDVLTSIEGELLKIRKACKEALDERDSLRAKLSLVRRKVEEIGNDSSLWKVPRIGGQDQYAGMPPACRIIDEILDDIKKR